MTRHPGWTVFRGYLLDQSGTRQAYLVNGSAKSFEGYREEVGWLKGAHFAARIPDEIRKLELAEATRRAAAEDSGD